MPAANNHGRAHTSSRSWTTIAGMVIGVLCMLSLFSLALLIALGLASFKCGFYPFVVLASALGFGLSTAFIGGSAIATTEVPGLLRQFFRGLIPIDVLPIVFSVTGGIAVVFLTLLVGHLIKPPMCGDIAEVVITFDQIPANAAIKMTDTYWTKHGGHQNDTQSYTILVGAADTEGTLDIKFLTTSSRCRLRLTTIWSKQVVQSGSWKVVENLATERRHLLVSYSAAAPTQRKRHTFHCFERNGVRLVEELKWDLQGGRLMTRDVEDLNPRSETELISEYNELLDEHAKGFQRRAEGLPPFGLVVSAHAQTAPKDYAGLRRELTHPNPDVGSRAERYLAEHFDRYGQRMVRDVVAVNQDPDMLASLLTSMTLGIGVIDAQLRPRIGRRLDVDVPYVKGQADALVELTGHENLRVRKEARRLIQYYPVDMFKQRYTEIIDDVQRTGCEKGTSDYRVYSAIFYFYNRGVQQLVNGEVPSTSNDEFDLIVPEVKKVANMCLEPKYALDAAVLDYAQLLRLAEREGVKSERWQTMAREFVETAGSAGDDYVVPLQVDKIRRALE